mgnify:CR=1 FL=1
MKSGYIALTSAIIISVLILSIGLSLSFTGFFSRFNVLDSEYKEKGFALAKACVDKALLKLAQNISYSGNEYIAVGNDQCLIFPVETLGNQKIVKTKAIFQNSVTNLKTIVNSSDFSIVSEEEISSL